MKNHSKLWKDPHNLHGIACHKCGGRQSVTQVVPFNFAEYHAMNHEDREIIQTILLYQMFAVIDLPKEILFCIFELLNPTYITYRLTCQCTEVQILSLQIYLQSLKIQDGARIFELSSLKSTQIFNSVFDLGSFGFYIGTKVELRSIDNDYFTLTTRQIPIGNIGTIKMQRKIHLIQLIYMLKILTTGYR